VAQGLLGIFLLHCQILIEVPGPRENEKARCGASPPLPSQAMPGTGMASLHPSVSTLHGMRVTPLPHPKIDTDHVPRPHPLTKKTMKLGAQVSHSSHKGLWHSSTDAKFYARTLKLQSPLSLWYFEVSFSSPKSIFIALHLKAQLGKHITMLLPLHKRERVVIHDMCGCTIAAGDGIVLNCENLIITNCEFF